MSPKVSSSADNTLTPIAALVNSLDYSPIVSEALEQREPMTSRPEGKTLTKALLLLGVTTAELGQINIVDSRSKVRLEKLGIAYLLIFVFERLFDSLRL